MQIIVHNFLLVTWKIIDILKRKICLFSLNFPRSEFMRQFLLYGHVLSTEEAELYADYELKKNPPTLDNFKEQVCFMFVV